jgi:hypothetical protein
MASDSMMAPGAREGEPTRRRARALRDSPTDGSNGSVSDQTADVECYLPDLTAVDVRRATLLVQWGEDSHASVTLTPQKSDF